MLLALVVACALVGCSGGVEKRIRRLYILGRRPSPSHVQTIEAALHDADRDVRTTALVVMQSVDPVLAQSMALEALADPDGLVRSAAVRVLGGNTDGPLVRRLARQAASDPVWQVRSAALEAIVGFDDPAVGEVSARALDDSVRHVRRVALEAGLAHPGLLPAERVSRSIVEDPDWENRVAAARVLGVSQDPAAFSGLDAACEDPNEFVRATAVRERRALERAGVHRPEVVAPAPGV